MQAAAALLLGEHDFSAFRAAECQSPTPVKTLRAITIARRGAYWRFEFEANAFLHHMVRNLMGTLLAVGQGSRAPAWAGEVLASRDRSVAAHRPLRPMGSTFWAALRRRTGLADTHPSDGLVAMTMTRIKICGLRDAGDGGRRRAGRCRRDRLRVLRQERARD